MEKNKEEVIKELNEYLKGEYMGIHGYEHYIHHTEDPVLKKELQRIQQEHKQHAAKTAERIQNLGGKAANDNGMKLTMAEMMMNFKKVPKDNKEIIKGVLEGQEMGVRKAEEIIKGDLDPESLAVIQANLEEDYAHIEQLNRMMEK
jgi:bacterioferritin